MLAFHNVFASSGEDKNAGNEEVVSRVNNKKTVILTGFVERPHRANQGRSGGLTAQEVSPQGKESTPGDSIGKKL